VRAPQWIQQLAGRLPKLSIFLRSLLPIGKVSGILVEVVFHRLAEKKSSDGACHLDADFARLKKAEFLRQAARSSKASTPVRQFLKVPKNSGSSGVTSNVSPACAKTAFEAG